MIGFTQVDSVTESMDRSQKEVKETILKFFKGFHSGDTTKIYNSMDKNMTLQTIVPGTKGKRTITVSNVKMFVLAIHNKPKSEN